jgi:hypothetical protein
MSILSHISTGRIARPQKVVLYGPEGVGKSTLAAQFPRPLFLDVEGGTSQMDVPRIGRDALPDWGALTAGIAEIAGARACGTLVLDTIDWAEALATADAIAAGGPKVKSIEDYGYGKGWILVRERLQALLAGLDAVVRGGAHVVLLAHSKVARMEPPDAVGAFDRYELKLSKQTAPLVKEWADMLLFANYRTQVREKDAGEAGAQYKGVGGKERVLYTSRSAAYDAKNRHGMPETMPLGIDPIRAAFAAVGAPWDAPAPAPAAPQAALPAGDALEAICAPREAAVNAYWRAKGKLAEGQTWRELPGEIKARIASNSRGFLEALER